jgi:hypothetical protein
MYLTNAVFRATSGQCESLYDILAKLLENICERPTLGASSSNPRETRRIKCFLTISAGVPVRRNIFFSSNTAVVVFAIVTPRVELDVAAIYGEPLIALHEKPNAAAVMPFCMSFSLYKRQIIHFFRGEHPACCCHSIANHADDT